MIYTIVNLSTLTSSAFLTFVSAIVYLLMFNLLSILNSLDTLVFIVTFSSFIIGVGLIVKRIQVAVSTQRPQYDPLQVYYMALGNNIDHADNGIYSLGHMYDDSLISSINESDYAISRTSSTNLTTPPKQPFERLTTVLQYEDPIHANHTDPYHTETTSAVDSIVPQRALHRFLSLSPLPSDSYKKTHVGHHNASGSTPSYERPSMGLGLINMNPNMQVPELATNYNTNQVDDDNDDNDYFPDPEDD